MSIYYNDEQEEIPWEQYHIWRKTSYWCPEEDEDLKNEDTLSKSRSISPNIGMLETALLSNKVVMYTIQDCVLSKIQTEILATLLPSELITQKSLQGKTRTKFVGVLMFGDVSGFTALCEKYFAEGGRSGTYKLTATLNTYIGAMVDVIYSYGGDIIKFSGDAFLAVWKVGFKDYLFEMVHKVIECAMYIQHSLGSFETDANVLLRVKLAISAGNVVFSSIGAEQSKYYVIYGVPVDDVKHAQDMCESGDVILAPSAWGHCSQVNYLFTNKDETHIKILRIIYHPMQVSRKVFQLPPKNIVDLEKKYKYLITRYKQLESDTDLNVKYETVRPEVNTAADRQLGPYLRPYLIPPVVAQVDAEQPLEYLTEMRQVTTVFINLVLEKKGIIDTIDKVDEVYTQIWLVVHKQMGVVNKVCMFDKDIMFLVIFGLRGAHHELNALKSLKSAYKIRSIISQMQNVLCISCGITVGMTYCGVVGHPLRQEYTVIGAPVNKAARLMMYYPNKVTCDQQTFFSSGLSSIYFIEQEQKVLKGIGKVGGIYEYTEGRRGTGNVNIYHLSPLLGQDSELKTFQAMLDGADGFPCGILYCGEIGVGKSRLLEEFLITCVNREYRTIMLTLQGNHAMVPFYALQSIFKHLFNMGSEENMRTRQDRIVNYLQATEYDKFGCLLNPILGMNITDRPPPDVINIVSNSMTDLKMMRENVFRKLVEVICVDMIIFIDNIEYCDNKSADFLPVFLEEGSAALVMTVSKKSYSKPRRWFKNNKLIIYQLECLEEEYIAPLACQLLGVRAIPVQIEELILNQKDANPGWCQRYLQSLLDSKAIQIEKVQRSKLDNMPDMIVPEFKLLQKRVIGQEFRPTRITFVTNMPLKESKNEEVSICGLVKATEDLEQTVPATMEAVIMSAFDCLSPYEQLLLKCGCVIGDTFSREMLHAVLFKSSPKETAKAIKRLFEMNIICCAANEVWRHHGSSSTDVKSYETNLTLTRDFEIACACRQRTSHDDFEDAYAFPYYAFCNELQFTVSLFRIKTYDLLPTNQKVLLHKRIAAFLELKLHPLKHLIPGTPNYWSMVLAAMSTMPALQAPTDTTVYEKSIKYRQLSVTRKSTFQPSLYEDIILHLHKAGLFEQEIFMAIEYSQASLLAGCKSRAANAIFLAEDRLKHMALMRKYEHFNIDELRGKLQILLAQGYLDMRNTKQSKHHINNAKLLLFGNSLKWCWFKILKASTLLKPTYIVHSYKTAHWIFGSKSFLDLTRIEFLNVLSCTHMVAKNWAAAKTAAIIAAIMVINSSVADVCLIGNTFSNLIDIYNHLGNFKKAQEVHKIALKMFSRVELDTESLIQITSYAKLQNTRLITCFLQGKLEECITIGEELLKIGFQISAWDTTLFIQTLIINAQMRLGIIDKIYYSIERLKTIGKNPLTNTHYYLNCIILHLYTGVIIRSTSGIIKLIEMNKLEITRPIVIALSLYLIRRDEISRHKCLQARMVPPKQITVYNVHYEIMYFEYILTKIAKQIVENCNSFVIQEEFAKANEIGKQLTAVIHVNAPHLMPRLLLLMAYSCQIKELDTRSNSYTKKALAISEKNNDKLESEWIKHNRKVWSQISKSKVVADNMTYYDDWIAHSAEKKLIYWKDYEKYSMSSLMYALPLPT